MNQIRAFIGVSLALLVSDVTAQSPLRLPRAVSSAQQTSQSARVSLQETRQRKIELQLQRAEQWINQHATTPQTQTTGARIDQTPETQARTSQTPLTALVVSGDLSGAVGTSPSPMGKPPENRPDKTPQDKAPQDKDPQSESLAKRDFTLHPRIDTSLTIPHANANDFSPTCHDPNALYHDADGEQWVYDSKFDVPTQHPWIEWGRVWYGDGITPRGKDWFGPMNMVRPKFYAYGDFRTGVQSGRNLLGRADNFASRLNLDLDLQLTDTERFHAFVGPLDKQNRFTRVELVDGDLRYRNEMNFTPATAFFEGDLGVMLGAAKNQSSPFELPITMGLMPLLFQNGIWMEDAVSGLAFALPAKHSRLLNWSNFDATFFAAFDQINSPAFADNSDAQAFGTAWFIEAYGGYIEAGYAYLNHRNDDSLSYHNATISFTRRYFDRISNSVRVIVNTGQERERQNRTADGGLLLVDNSWITSSPLTVVPYANFFYGWRRPQSVARAGISGGILRNTGINFDTDGLNGFATLDVTAADTGGCAIGVDLIGDQLDRQLLLEFAYLNRHGDLSVAQGNQYAVGARYQFPISNATLLRFDVMHGWRDGEEDVYGTRMEYRWKF
ncbi:MAG: hypothetical protein AAFV88_17800 [Planctomycetota bacterium]